MPTHVQGSPTHTRVLQHTLLAYGLYRFSSTTIKNPYSLRSLFGKNMVILRFSEKYFDQKQGYLGSIELILRRSTTQNWSPIDPRGSRSILSKSIFRVKFPLFFPIKSSYFNPGSLRKSSGDVRDHFLNIWL